MPLVTEWVGALVRFNFQLEYQKGWDNTVADMLSQITTCNSAWRPCAIHPGWSIPRCHSPGAEGYDPGSSWRHDYGLEKEEHVTAGWVLVEMHVTDWVKTQREDPVLNAVLDWLEAQKKTDMKTLLGEHASSVDSWLVWRKCTKILWSNKKPSTYAQHPRGRVRN